MSHYKPYPAYKESGVEWLGKVPEHWQVKQLKYLASHIGSGKTPSGGAEVYQDAGVLFLRSQNVYEDGLRLDDAAFISDEVDEEMKGSRVKPGDVLLNITGASIGRSCLVPEAFERANVNQHVCIIRGEPPLASKWISLCLPSKAVQAQIDFSQNGAGREGLNFEQIGNMFIALPHAEEVDEIASRLDRETARIDALIEKKTRFIELLREKRQALITHAVTKGLDQNVKMKDSGVEWLGEVPEHWETMSLARVTVARCDGPFGSAIKSENYTDSGVRVIRLQNIGIGEFKDGDQAFLSPEYRSQVIGNSHDVELGDLLIAGLGDENNPLGRTCVAPDSLGDAIVKADCYRFRLDRSRALPSFLALQLSATARVECGFISTGSTRERLNLGLAASRVIALPPSTEEQFAIVEQTAMATVRLDALLSKTERSIELLKERRSALITAAVTGQIDLREAV